MYELNRARLIGVGPRGARYTDVTLDLSGIGVATSGRTLFDGPTRRPSPVSLMMLENGGGKTVLLKLLFSVVLPGRKKVMDGKSSSLERFVLGNDAGHVALEWMHVVTGDLLVTAKVFQLRGPSSGQQPAGRSVVFIPALRQPQPGYVAHDREWSVPTDGRLPRSDS